MLERNWEIADELELQAKRLLDLVNEVRQFNSEADKQDANIAFENIQDLITKFTKF